ncbi:MAG: GTPase [Nanoarchaeota archaeon]
MANPIGKAKLGRGKSERTNKHLYSVPALVNKIIYEADIILEILDARFIEKTRIPEIEKKVRGLGKTLIYVFNKSDLVDVNKVKANIELENLKPHVFFSYQDRKSAALLKRLLKIEASRLKKDVVNIGVVGYPNSGKSSLINLLVGRKSARTSPEAGYTKGIQKIKISSGIYLIDTPGIIPPAEKTSINREILSKQAQIGAITWDRTKNPDMVVFRLMKEYPTLLEKYYGIDAQGDSEILIEQLGRRLHYLKKGNEIDEVRAAKHVLKDWQKGKIRQ